MAKCKICKTNIPDGTEYCNNCQDKGDLLSNESYLDSLLNSVKNTAPTAEEVYKKRNSSSINSPETEFRKTKEPDPQDFDIYRVDLGDIEDFDQFNLDEDLEDIPNDIIDDEDLFGEDLSKMLSGDNEGASRYNSKYLTQTSLLEEDKRQPENILGDLDSTEVDEMKNSSYLEEQHSSDGVTNNFNPDEVKEFHEEEDIDSDLEDLLNHLNLEQEEDEEEQLPNLDKLHNSENDISSLEHNPWPIDDEIHPAAQEEYEQIDADEDDFLSLLNQISSDDPVAEDVKAINNILSGNSVNMKENASMPSDVGDVFSDALKVVTSLNDPSIDETALLNSIPDKKKGKKDKKNKKNKVKKDETEKPKKSLFKRLFGNIKDENSKKKKKSSSKSIEEDNDVNEIPVKGKAKKSKKDKASKGKNTDASESKNPKDKAGAEAQNKKESKKEKKEKKKKTKEVIQVIDEIDEDEGRINRLGASIVFIFFGLMVLLLLVGTNVVSYTLSIQKATNYFDKQKYTKAYNEVYGIEIKDEDIEIYDKIMTVMYVNKQLNSYNNYYSIKQYPQALDSLLKGLKRYNKYIELATMLGIKTDLDYVRSQILAELKNVFKLSEKEAIKMINNDNQDAYSLEIYDIIAERMNN